MKLVLPGLIVFILDRDNRFATPLHYSVQLAAFTSGSEEEEEEGGTSTRALECCHVLLQAGADPNAVDVSHSPPVLWAARYPHALAAIRLLQLSGAKIDIQNETGLSALHLAAQEGLIDTCRCLVEECAFPVSRSSHLIVRHKRFHGNELSNSTCEL